MRESVFPPAATLLTFLCLTAASFWFAAMRYIGLDPPDYRQVVLAFWLLTCLLALRCWLQQSRKRAAIVATAWVVAIVLGELPWRLNSRAMLNWLWDLFGLLSNDLQKIAAGYCVDATTSLLGTMLIAAALEGVRIWKLRRARA